MSRKHNPCRHRFFVPPALLLAGLGLGMAAPSGAERIGRGEDIAVQCAGGRGFMMRVKAEEAMVRVYGRDLVLQRRVSSALQHYSSAHAALVIDGDYVAFVMDDALDFNACHLVTDTEPAALPGRR